MVSGQDCAGSTLVDRGVESQGNMEGQLAEWGGACSWLLLLMSLACPFIWWLWDVWPAHAFYAFLSSYHFVTSNTVPSHLAQAYL